MKGVIMEYLLRKKLFNSENEFEIKCEENTKYIVSSVNKDEIHISSAESGKVIQITNIKSVTGREFKISLYGRMVLKAVCEDKADKQITFRSMYGDEYEVSDHKGNIELNCYIIRKNGLRVAKAFRKPLSNMNEYSIDIIEAENQALILAISIVMDECF